MAQKKGVQKKGARSRGREERDIPLNRIFLDGNNPRHEELETEREIIEYLCDNEEVQVLARDIVEHGLSPFDRFGVIPDNDETGNLATYIIAEGNRRLCALKLLTDPDLAPTKRRAFFQKLSDS